MRDTGSSPEQHYDFQTTPKRALVLLCGQGVFLGFAISVFYTVSNTLFLTEHSSAFLPYVYIVTALFVSLVSFLFVSLQKKWSLGTFTAVTLASFTALIVISRIGMFFFDARWISFALMVLFTLFLQLSLIVLGSQAGQIFNVQQMKRLFPAVMAGQVFGVILGGAVVGTAAQLMGGTENLLILAGGGMAAAWMLLVFTNHQFRSSLRGPAVHDSPRFGASPVLLLKKPYIRLLLLFQITIYVTTNLVNYLFINRIDTAFDSAPAMTRFLGNFMATSTLVTLLFLALFSGRLLMRYGVGIGLAANCLTVGLAVGCAAVLALGWSSSLPLFFWLIMAARLLNFVANSSMTDPTVKAMYQPLPSENRATVQIIVEGMGVPLAIGIAGLFLLVFQGFPSISVGHVALFTFLFFGLLAYFGYRLFKKYEETLLESLGRYFLKPADISLADKSSLTAVEKLLHRPGAGMVRLALDMLEHGDVQLTPYLAELLDHHDPSVRREVYSRAERQHAVELLPLIAGKLDNEPDAEVKAAALRAFCALNPDGVDRVLPYLDMGSWAVKAGAMTGLLRYGGIYGAMNAGRRLQEWLDSRDPTRLLHAAKMVGEVAHGSFYQPLTPLFTHPAVEVRREALLAAGAVGNRNLLPQMAAALENREVRSAAIQALARMGEGFLPLLQDALCDECRFKKETLLRIIRIAAQIRSSVLIPALKEHIRYPNLEIRHELLRSLSLCRYRAYAGEVLGVKEMIREELQTGIYLVAAEDVFGETEAAVLRSALHDEVKWARKRIFLLLSFLYDPATVAGIAERLEAGSEGEQSLALELLDFTVSRELKGPLLAFLDTRLPLEKRIKNLGLNNGSKETVLADLIAGRSVPRNDWTRACAVYIAGELDKGDKDMLTIEKVIALKSAEIFANTSDFALVSLASIADEIHVTARETFIRKGDMENCMYLVISGRVRVHDEGREIACLGDGEIIGEMSLLDPAPRSASVTAMEDTQLFRIEKDAFDIVMADNPEITQGVLRVLCRRLRSKIGSNV